MIGFVLDEGIDREQLGPLDELVRHLKETYYLSDDPRVNGPLLNFLRAVTGQTGVADAPPPAFDWRDRQALSDVVDQSDCGCCWAASSVSMFSDVRSIAMGFPVNFSARPIIQSCTESKTTGGCCGVAA